MTASIRNIKLEISIMSADDELCGRGHKPDPRIREIEIEKEAELYHDYMIDANKEEKEMI